MENLMKNPIPKNLKDLLKLIIPPKGVKREENVNGVPTDEGNELYDCNGDEISYRINIEDQFGPPIDDQNEQTVENTNANKPFVDLTSTDTPHEQTQNQRDPLIELTPLCNHPDLKKDAALVDDLAKFIKTHKNSSKFLPLITSIKKHYLTARRQVEN